MKYLFSLLLLFALIISPGCLTKRGGPAGEKGPGVRKYSIDFIRSIKLSYSTSTTLLEFNDNRVKTPFPENTKGVILRISAEDAPEDTKLTVSWFSARNREVPVAIQSVMADELNSHQYVDLTFYHQEYEFPKGDYEVIVKDEKESRLEKILFSVL